MRQSNAPLSDRKSCPPNYREEPKVTKVDMSSAESVNVLKMVRKSNFDSEFSDRYWRIEHMAAVQNERLKKNYVDFKNELKSLGRKKDDIDDVFVFSAETEKACKEICREGYKVGLKKRHVLGYTGSGIHLVRNYDILSRYMAYQQFTSPAYIMVYKAFLGKAKPIVPRLHKDDNFVSPWSGFDCHISARKIEPNMPICEALNCSYVYFYEYDEIASNTVKFPRQILPHGIIQMSRKYTIGTEIPFLAVGKLDKISPVEVQGETRRGFRFIYPQPKRKVKPNQVVHRNTRKLIKTSLQEQLLEMRTKGDWKSNSASLKKCQTNSLECTAKFKDKPMSRTALGKRDKTIVKFQGKVFCVSPTSLAPQTLLQTKCLDCNVDHVCKCTHKEHSCKKKKHKCLRSLPMSLRPYVSIKRLQMNNKFCVKYNTVCSDQAKTIQEGAIVESISKNMVDKKDNNDTNNERSTLADGAPSRQVLCGPHMNDTEHLSILKEKNKKVTVSRKEIECDLNSICDVALPNLNERKKHAIDTIRLLSTVKILQSNVKHTDSFQIPIDDKERQNLISSMGPNFGEFEKVKFGRKMTDFANEVKQIYENGSQKIEIQSSDPQNKQSSEEAERSLSKERDISIKGDNGLTQPSVYNKKPDFKSSDRDNDNQQSNDAGICSNMQSEATLEGAAVEKTRTGSRKGKVKRKKHEVKTDKNTKDAIRNMLRTSLQSKSLPKAISEVSSTRNGPKPFCSSTMAESNTQLKINSDFDQIKSTEVETQARMNCVQSHKLAPITDITRKGKQITPKTIKDLFREPLHRKLIEKMKSNDRLTHYSHEFDSNVHANLTKTSSPPAGVIAPSQLNFSPKVASASVPKNAEQSISVETFHTQFNHYNHTTQNCLVSSAYSKNVMEPLLHMSTSANSWSGARSETTLSDLTKISTMSQFQPSYLGLTNMPDDVRLPSTRIVSEQQNCINRDGLRTFDKIPHMVAPYYQNLPLPFNKPEQNVSELTTVGKVSSLAIPGHIPQQSVGVLQKSSCEHMHGQITSNATETRKLCTRDSRITKRHKGAYKQTALPQENPSKYVVCSDTHKVREMINPEVEAKMESSSNKPTATIDIKGTSDNLPEKLLALSPLSRTNKLPLDLTTTEPLQRVQSVNPVIEATIDSSSNKTTASVDNTANSENVLKPSSTSKSKANLTKDTTTTEELQRVLRVNHEIVQTIDSSSNKATATVDNNSEKNVPGIVLKTFRPSKTKTILSKDATTTEGLQLSTKALRINHESEQTIDSSSTKKIEHIDKKENSDNVTHKLLKHSSSSQTKPNLSIDATTAEKLQRVLRKHISEVNKIALAKQPKSGFGIEESRTNQLKSDFQVTKDLKSNECLSLPTSKDQEQRMDTNENGVNINSSIKEDSNYNLLLLARQSGQDDKITVHTEREDSKSNVCLEETNQICSMNSTNETVKTQHFDNDSQDTVIGGIRLSPERQELLNGNLKGILNEQNTQKDCSSESTKHRTQMVDNCLKMTRHDCEHEISTSSTHEKMNSDAEAKPGEKETELNKRNMDTSETSLKVDELIITEGCTDHITNVQTISFMPDFAKNDSDVEMSENKFNDHSCATETDISVKCEPLSVDENPEALADFEDQSIHQYPNCITKNEEEYLEDNYEEPPDISQLHCSKVFGQFHRIRNPNIENRDKQPPGSCRSAILDTLQELSKVLQILSDNDVSSKFDVDSNSTKIISTDIVSTCEALGSDPLLMKTPNGTRGKITEYLEQETNELIPLSQIKMETDFEPSSENKQADNSKQTVCDIDTGSCFVKSVKKEPMESTSISTEPHSPVEDTTENVIRRNKQLFEESVNETIQNDTKLGENNVIINKRKQLTDNASILLQDSIHSQKEEVESQTDNENKGICLNSVLCEEPNILALETFGNCYQPAKAHICSSFVEASRPDSAPSKDLDTRRKSPNITSCTDTEIQSNTSPGKPISPKSKVAPNVLFRGKAGMLNKGMKDRKNIFDTKLGIQRMRAKLSNPLITQIATEIDCANQVKYSTSKQNQQEAKTEVPLHTEKSDQPRIQDVTCVATQGTDIDTNEKANKDKVDIPINNEKRPGVVPNEKEDLVVSKNDSIETNTNTNMSNNTTDKNSVEICVQVTPQIPVPEHSYENRHHFASKTGIIPFNEVMRKKKEQYLRYKHGLTHKKFIDYDEFKQEIMNGNQEFRGNHSSFGRYGINKDRSKCYQKYSVHNKSPEKLVPPKQNEFVQPHSEPVISERGTKLYEDSLENDCPMSDIQNIKEIHRKEWTHLMPHSESNKTHANDTFPTSVNANNHPKESGFLLPRHEKTPLQSEGTQRTLMLDSTARQMHCQVSHDLYNQSHYTKPNFFPTGKQVFPQYKRGPYYFQGNFRKFPFNHGKKGFFSWRRKYQTPVKAIGRGERVYVTRKGVVQTEEEHKEWKMFKEREKIRLQIEQAIKEYRRTFENTGDDMVGDEKVSKYLQTLTDKLDHIQNKRNMLSQHFELKQRTREIPEKENTNNQSQPKEEPVESQRLISVDKFRESFGQSFHTNIQRKQEHTLVDELCPEPTERLKQTNFIEQMLKEHVHKHLETVTERLKLELTAKLASGGIIRDDAGERSIASSMQERENISKIVEKELKSVRNMHAEEPEVEWSRSRNDRSMSNERETLQIYDSHYRHYYSNDSYRTRSKSPEPGPYYSNSKDPHRYRKSRSGSREIYHPQNRSPRQYTKPTEYQTNTSKEMSRSQSRSVSPQTVESEDYRYYLNEQKGHGNDSRYAYRHTTRYRSPPYERTGRRSRSPGKTTLNKSYRMTDTNDKYHYSRYRKRSRSQERYCEHDTFCDSRYEYEHGYPRHSRSRSRSRERYDEHKSFRQRRYGNDLQFSNDNGDNEGENITERIMPENNTAIIEQGNTETFNKYYNSAVRSKWDDSCEEETSSDKKSTNEENNQGCNDHRRFREINGQSEKAANDTEFKNKLAYREIYKEHSSKCVEIDLTQFEDEERLHMKPHYRFRYDSFEDESCEHETDKNNLYNDSSFNRNHKHQNGRFPSNKYKSYNKYRYKPHTHQDKRKFAKGRYNNKHDEHFPSTYYGYWKSGSTARGKRQSNDHYFKYDKVSTHEVDKCYSKESEKPASAKMLSTSKPSPTDETVNDTQDNSFVKMLPTPSLKSIQNSYTITPDNSDSEGKSHSPRPIPTICRR